MTRFHPSISINHVLLGIDKKRTDKAKNKYASCFIKNPTKKDEAYIELSQLLWAMKIDGRAYFTDSECDNAQPNGSCGGHES